MKKLLTVLLVMVLCLALTACGGDKEEVYTVGIVQQMPHIALDSATQGFQDALVAELGEGKVDFPAIIAKLKELGYTGALTIEREISGEKQVEDILKAKALLEKYI